jgi:hypothetical protein
MNDELAIHRPDRRPESQGFVAATSLRGLPLRETWQGFRVPYLTYFRVRAKMSEIAPSEKNTHLAEPLRHASTSRVET